MKTENIRMEKYSVLIVDDDNSSIEILKNILKYHYVVRAAIDPKAVLKILASSNLPDLILLDVIMPDIDGYELCKMIKSNPKTQNIPIIFVTSEQDAKAESLGFELGASDYINKPVNPSTVLARVKTHLLFSDTNKELQHQVELKRIELENTLFTDSLTGLKNTQVLLNDIENTQEAHFLALVNLNKMHEINEFYGNKLGDISLIVFCKKLIEVCQDIECTVYRTHGNTFGVLCNVPELFETLRKCLYEFVEFTLVNSFDIQNQEETFQLPLETSIGIAQGYEKVFALASMALHEAKRNNQPFYELHSSDATTNNMELASSIRQAIKDYRIISYFQPIVNNKTKKIEKFETLMRYIKPDGTVVTPYHFLEAAKGARLYPFMTRMIQEQACSAFTNREEQFSINIGWDDILDINTRNYIIKMLDASCAPERIIFELVESESLSDSEIVNDFIDAIKMRGAKIAIDDFGSGYSNFEYLLRIKADIIKIDGSLIKDIDTNSQKRSIVKSIVSFAQDIGIETVAEFVSSESIYNVVTEMGITYSQGFYFGKPEAELP